MNTGIYFFIILLCYISAFAENSGIVEDSTMDTNTLQSTLISAEIPPVNRPELYALNTINSVRNEAIAGSVMFFSGMALEWGVLTSWSMRFNEHLEAQDTVTAKDGEESRMMLIASIPIGVLQIGGASIACAGASRVNGVMSKQ